MMMISDSSTPRLRTPSRLKRKESWSGDNDCKSTTSTRKSSPPVFTFGQTMVFAIACSFFAVFATSLLWLLSAPLHHSSSHQSNDNHTVSHLPHGASTNTLRPQVAWLMSFPNSGTSFTLHNTREASNCTTGTNYALEGDIEDKASVNAIPGPLGDNGPWWQETPENTAYCDTMLTKTHCKAFCTARLGCSEKQVFQTVRSFMIGCLEGTRAVETPHGLQKLPVVYDKSLVTKAIHVLRNPLDNIVARFHLDFDVEQMGGNVKYGDRYPRNMTGFHRWCDKDDEDKKIMQSKFMDTTLKRLMERIPCHNDFFRYVMWHNLAFATSHHMNLPTMILNYEEYTMDYEGTRNRILDFLGLERVGEGEPFKTGKVYGDYYTDSMKIAIREFFQEASSAETWEQLKQYFLADDYIFKTASDHMDVVATK